MNYDYEMIHLIIIAAVRKGYKWAATCNILTCDCLLAGKTSLCLQTRRNDAVPCSNLPLKPTRTTQNKKPYYKLTFVNFEHWLVMYFILIEFRIMFYQKSYRLQLYKPLYQVNTSK